MKKITFLFLAITLIPGIGKIRNGSRSWFGIGSLGIQPSEFAKIGLIIYVAKYLASNQKSLREIIKGVFHLESFVIFVVYIYYYSTFIIVIKVFLSK